MENLAPNELQFWQEYLASVAEPERLAGAQVSASMARDERNADALLQLYLEGKKSAGSGLVKDYETAGDPLPTEGCFWIILDSLKRPRCIVKTIRVEMHTFDAVPEKVAIAEGEGDLSLAFWREAHMQFFEPYLKDLGITNLGSEKIVTEFFEVVFKK